jgi:sulfatase maturation enzyme AslB (radical SAM superfamily)
MNCQKSQWLVKSRIYSHDGVRLFFFAQDVMTINQEPSPMTLVNPMPAVDVEPNVSIEQGYFIFTLMPSLRCSLNCPHCYLTLEQRRHSPIMSLDDLQIACTKIDAYFTARQIPRRKIVCYWYGGEPTEMGQDYFTRAADLINATFCESKGYAVKHVVLSSLLIVDESWYPIFDKYGKGEVQTSFDGLMRGGNYVKRWEEKVRKVVDYGLRLATISVVNRELIDQSPEDVLDYLGDLGVAESGWLPFMWNEQNNGDNYNTFAPRMDEYSDFMIRLCQHWLKRKMEGRHMPHIGQMSFILGQKDMPLLSNVAGQTLFLLPDGDFVLPDYKNGYQEFMQPFGNILSQSFEEVLTSPARRKYLRRQTLRNRNPECLSCEHIDKCVMEFWKDNRAGDDCFGAKKFVNWVVENAPVLENAYGENSSFALY